MATKTYTDEEIRTERRREFEELMDWLRNNGARLCDRHKIGNRGDELALYQFAGRTLIVQTYARGDGWEFYAPITTDTTWEGTRKALQAMLDKTK
jgi:hypothetical protein